MNILDRAPTTSPFRGYVCASVIMGLSIVVAIAMVATIAWFPPSSDEARMAIATVLLLSVGSVLLSAHAMAVVGWSTYIHERVHRLQAENDRDEAVERTPDVVRSVAMSLLDTEQFSEQMNEAFKGGTLNEQSGRPSARIGQAAAAAFGRIATDEAIAEAIDSMDNPEHAEPITQ